MTTATVTIDCTLDCEDYENILDTAGYVIGYWASAASIELKSEDDEEVIYRVTDSETGIQHVLDRLQIERAIVTIVCDNRTASEQLRRIMASQDYGDIDADLADTIIQTACFGEIIYD